ncbi:MAG: glycosyltransferase family 2 protein [Candidatus Pacebacteria bacterium]|nr:glycosyltransferase family 2 protein [Candidatus Paceibacterota bacterium]
MKPELTIIIPCYNCYETLEAAVESCFIQNLSSFEIIMVDDGSTDSTWNLMQILTSRYPEIRIYRNEKNLGGGATRNRAIKESAAEIIFCLDSDDLLPENTLSLMLTHMKRLNCDGVGIHKSIKFKGADVSDVFRVDEFGYVNEKIPLNALIENTKGPFNPLYSTFMHTKKAFEITNGYTEFHGFDTQSFAWRFLAHGLYASTCPEATYLHRQHFNKSYYVREYESGKTNYNWFEVLDEFLILFKEHVQKEILSFNFTQTTIGLMDLIKSYPEIFNTEFTSNLDQNYSIETVKRLSKSQIMTERYWAGSEYIRKGLYNEALAILNTLSETEFPYPALKEKIQMAQLCREGTSQREAYKKIENIRNYVKRGDAESIVSKMLRKAKKIIKNNSALSKVIFGALSFKNNLIDLYQRKSERAFYYERIEYIKKTKEIIFDIRFGGLGDWMAFTSLPRLLHEQYGIKFYLTTRCIASLRNNDIFKLCFEMNPYFKGVRDDGNFFEFEIFASDKSIYNIITDQRGCALTEIVERQFGLNGEGIPEIYYRPNILNEYSDTILVDKNYISGKKLGWFYKDKTFDNEIEKRLSDNRNLKIEEINPTKQNLFQYVDMISSCHYFITVLSGGAAVAAALPKPFTAVLPYNIHGGSVDIFTFKKSSGYYVR